MAARKVDVSSDLKAMVFDAVHERETTGRGAIKVSDVQKMFDQYYPFALKMVTAILPLTPGNVQIVGTILIDTINKLMDAKSSTPDSVATTA